MIFSVRYFIEVLPVIAKSLNITIELSLISLFFSLVIGTFVAVAAYYKIKIVNPICRVYVSIFRGTPLLPQIFFMYFGLAYVFDFVKTMTPMVAVAVVMSLNMGAYMSENIRGALNSIDEGQKEAAYSLGMTDMQLMIRIIAPQAFRIALPSLFNNFIDLIKGSSVAFVVGVADIMGAAKTQGAMNFRYFEIYAVVMLLYWLLITLISALQYKLEKKCAAMY